MSEPSGFHDGAGVTKRRRVLFVELNTDGTVGGSYFSLLYLTINLDRERFEPIVFFAQPNSLMSRFKQGGIEVHALAPYVPLKSRRILFRPIVRLANFVAF